MISDRLSLLQYGLERIQEHVRMFRLEGEGWTETNGAIPTAANIDACRENSIFNGAVD